MSGRSVRGRVRPTPGPIRNFVRRRSLRRPSHRPGLALIEHRRQPYRPAVARGRTPRFARGRDDGVHLWPRRRLSPRHSDRSNQCDRARSVWLRAESIVVTPLAHPALSTHVLVLISPSDSLFIALPKPDSVLRARFAPRRGFTSPTRRFPAAHGLPAMSSVWTGEGPKRRRSSDKFRVTVVIARTPAARVLLSPVTGGRAGECPTS